MKETLIKEWDYEKNGPIDPLNITDHSNKKFYWICPKGHPSYLMPVTKRTLGHGCPVCSNHRIIKGINDFESLNPELMGEWSWDDNTAIGLDPSTFSSGSGIIAWWICKKCGNKWRASISNRVRLHSGCPFCAHLRVKKGLNDLATVRPHLAQEWDYEKNAPLKPDEIVAFYAKKVWWRCQKCHNSWQTTPNRRTKTGCPYCSNRIILSGFNDLASEHPDLAKEWDFALNQKLPSQYSSGSEVRVWWKCKKGHSWKATINSRVRGNGCPYCSNQKILIGYNDLFTTNPELKEEWDYQKNTSLLPSAVTAGSDKKVWWKCKICGNEWSAAISSRVNRCGCPSCGRKKATIERLKTMAVNNPLTAYQDLIAEWDFEKNQTLDLSLIPAGSNKYAWWKCKEGHSFKTRIVARTLKNVGCPYCHGQKVLPGINDLQTLCPWLIPEWDYEKNAPLLPSQVFSHGTQHVWWKCRECGNSWKAKIHNRANGRGCPVCNPYGTSFVEQTVFFYVRQIYDDAVNRYLFKRFELDIYIPSIQTAIEYDGSYFHSNARVVEREKKKDLLCSNEGIRLIRLREKPLGFTENAINFSCDCTTWKMLEETCKELIRFLKPDSVIEPSIQRDYREIIKYRKRLEKKSYYQYSFFD